MKANGYRLLGFAVWQGGKWYLRRRLPLRRLLVLGALGTGAVLASAVLARRGAS
jgi:hypothetical protein